MWRTALVWWMAAMAAGAAVIGVFAATTGAMPPKGVYFALVGIGAVLLGLRWERDLQPPPRPDLPEPGAAPADAEASAHSPKFGWMSRRAWNRLWRDDPDHRARYSRCPLGHWVLFVDLGEDGHYVRFIPGEPTDPDVLRATDEWLTWWRTRRI
jgi:hypothetical protein